MFQTGKCFRIKRLVLKAHVQVKSKLLCVAMFQSYDEALMVLSEAERKYVTDKCLAALYMPLLLDYGFGFSNDSSFIHVLGNIAGQKPGKHCNTYYWLLRDGSLITNHV